MCCAAKG